MMITAGPASGPTPLVTSQEVRDRGSAFVGYVYRANTTEDARAVAVRHHEWQQDRARQRQRHRQPRLQADPTVSKGKGADKDKDGDGDGEALTPYTIAAWRCMAVKAGRTGLGGPDEFEVVGGSDDGGERYAGKKVLGVVQREGVIDAVVIVSRWFGGTLLGPVRFDHIETCAREACRKFKKVEEMEECVQALGTLDDILATLRAQLEQAKADQSSSSPTIPSGESPAKSKTPDYNVMKQDLDLTKAKRLIHARERAIENTKTLIEKYKSST